jgi:PhzF family phenazine biosynthesis protein
VAVVLQGDGLTTAQMHQFANWTHLSEDHVCGSDHRPEGGLSRPHLHARVRDTIRGHPTIGTAHALLEAGMVRAHDGSLMQQCGAGLVRLTVEHEADGEEGIAFDMPQATFTELAPPAVAELEAILGLEVLRRHTPSVVHAGTHWVVAQLADADAVLGSGRTFST